MNDIRYAVNAKLRNFRVRIGMLTKQIVQIEIGREEFVRQEWDSLKQESNSMKKKKRKKKDG